MLAMTEGNHVKDFKDDHLVMLAQQGDSSAMEELLSRHREMIYRVMCRYADSEEEAEDLVQDTMLRAFLNIDRFRQEARFSTWLTSIAINIALALKRKNKHVQWIPIDEELKGEDRRPVLILRDQRPTPEQLYIKDELHELLRKEIRRIRPRYRFILESRDLNDAPIEITANNLGISTGAAKSRLCRAHKILSRAFKKYTASKLQETTEG